MGEREDFEAKFEQAVRESFPPDQADRILGSQALRSALIEKFWEQYDAGCEMPVDPSQESAEEKLQRADANDEAEVGLVARPGTAARRARFFLGEMVHLKGCKFQVVELGDNVLVLEPVAPETKET